jgi:histidinol-phosphate phosphatase family protein
MPLRPAVFLDRDGTLIEEVGYLDRLDRLQRFPWSIDAVRLLNRAGFAVAVVSNQAGVARGFCTEEFVREVQRTIDARMTGGGARIEGWYYCPHHPDAPLAQYRRDCDCRKPRPGMLRQAERELGIDPARSYVVGDRWLDVKLGRGVGARGILVRTGYGASEERRLPDALRQAQGAVSSSNGGVTADLVADNLIDAVSWILRQTTNDERRTTRDERR